MYCYFGQHSVGEQTDQHPLVNYNAAYCTAFERSVSAKYFCNWNDTCLFKVIYIHWPCQLVESVATCLLPLQNLDDDQLIPDIGKYILPQTLSHSTLRDPLARALEHLDRAQPSLHLLQQILWALKTHKGHLQWATKKFNYIKPVAYIQWQLPIANSTSTTTTKKQSQNARAYLIRWSFWLSNVPRSGKYVAKFTDLNIMLTPLLWWG